MSVKKMLSFSSDTICHWVDSLNSIE